MTRAAKTFPVSGQLILPMLTIADIDADILKTERARKNYSTEGDKTGAEKAKRLLAILALARAMLEQKNRRGHNGED